MKNIQMLLRRILLQFGPLLLAGLVIWLLSGGFPPANWRLLGLVLLHQSVYQTAQGSSLQKLVLILSIQSVLLVIVWTWWFILALRELSAFLKGPSQTAPARKQSFIPIIAPAAIKPASATSSADNVPGTRKNPFENLANRRHQSGTITLGQAAEAKKEQQRQARLEAEVKKEQQRKALLAADKSEQVSPASKRNASDKLALPPSSSQDASASTGGSSKQLDPFAVQPDLMDSFELPNLLAPVSPLDAGPASKADETPAEFVFGNPFEGPLPEVFEYDADLKQLLSGMKPQTGPMPNSPNAGQ